jgi:hypothetical protein
MTARGYFADRITIYGRIAAGVGCSGCVEPRHFRDVVSRDQRLLGLRFTESS